MYLPDECTRSPRLYLSGFWSLVSPLSGLSFPLKKCSLTPYLGFLPTALSLGLTPLGHSVSVLCPEFLPSLDSPGGPSLSFPFCHHRATQEELQHRPSPAAETPPLQRRPSVRAVISTAETGAGRGPPQVEPIPEAEEARRPGGAATSSGADPASPDLGPRGPDLASLQAERDVVSGVGLGWRRDRLRGVSYIGGWGLALGAWSDFSRG